MPLARHVWCAPLALSPLPLIYPYTSEKSLCGAGHSAAHDRETCESEGDGQRCTYTAQVAAAAESCSAVDNADCEAVDITGDVAASASACEGFGGGSRCVYTSGCVTNEVGTETCYLEDAEPLAVQYNSHEPTASDDRVCELLTECTTGEWQSRAPTPSADRVCEPITECFANEVEESAPTATSDRVCIPLETEPEPEPQEERTRTQFEARCVMSQFVPPVSSPLNVISGCYDGRSVSGGCNVPNLVTQSMYVLNQYTGTCSV